MAEILGAVLYPNPDIMPNVPIACPNAGGAATAGNIVKMKNQEIYGELQDSIATTEGDGTLRGLVHNYHSYFPKTEAGSGKGIAQGDYLTPKLISSTNHYALETCADGDPIVAIANTTQLTTDLFVEAKLLSAPYVLAVVGS